MYVQIHRERLLVNQMCLLVVRQKNYQNYDVTSGNYDVISRYLLAEKRSHIKYLRCAYHIRYNRNM